MLFLHIDDDDLYLEKIRRSLEIQNIDCISFGSTESAYQYIEKEGLKKIKLIILDHHLNDGPDESEAFAKKIKSAYPGAAILLLSGSDVKHYENLASEHLINNFCNKKATWEELFQTMMLTVHSAFITTGFEKRIDSQIDFLAGYMMSKLELPGEISEIRGVIKKTSRQLRMSTKEVANIYEEVSRLNEKISQFELSVKRECLKSKK